MSTNQLTIRDGVHGVQAAIIVSPRSGFNGLFISHGNRGTIGRINPSGFCMCDAETFQLILNKKEEIENMLINFGRANFPKEEFGGLRQTNNTTDPLNLPGSIGESRRDSYYKH